ncbi:hypothetical protein [Candidatus Magnetominusculus xianensis]|uniref:Uncharacterized protein n=1 Tax=Candidatus Magnetominusculus xianensis TaxID=1748249 RepID=A0ABR5SBS4_9BACT|nr:hypothetical protein [Candidatus Magnetominusculus xianensis]KWT78270.1 hypothetical protein ASN18_2874 [Candidatus Magnetominusculus xianensis]MBF0404042.1 hypothetical protein [Nitrospirota bacterium]
MTAAFGLKAAHYIRGRLRLKVETDMDMRVFFIFLSAAIKRVNKIKKAQLNRFAASVTLYFDDSGENDNARETLLVKLGSEIDFIMSLSNFANAYEEILNALCFDGADEMEINIEGNSISVAYPAQQVVKSFLASKPFAKDTVLPASVISAGLLTLLLAPALPTPAWLVLMIFGYSSLKQYESTKAIEQLLLQTLKPEQTTANG